MVVILDVNFKMRFSNIHGDATIILTFGSQFYVEVSDVAEKLQPELIKLQSEMAFKNGTES
jgi:hypothetical protein